MGKDTMLVIVLIKLVMAAVCRFSKIEETWVSRLLGLFCFVLLLAIYFVTKMFKKSLSQTEIQPIPGLTWLPGVCKKISRRVDAGVLLLSALQVMLFFLC